MSTKLTGTKSGIRRVGRLLLGAAMILGVLVSSQGTASAERFCNTAPIVGVPGSGTQLPPNPSNPYPSPINVSGLTGTITDVNVELLNLNTTGDNNNPPQHWPSDIDVMVTAPSGTAVVVMSDAGDDGNTDPVAPTFGALTGVNLVLDDQAANPLPADTRPLTSGTFRPVNDNDTNDPPDEWPGSPAPTGGGSSLSAFNGLNPNGTWNLWAVDDTAQAGVNFSGGWCVDILTMGGGGTTPTTGGTTTTTAPTTTTTAPTTTTTAPTTTTTAPTTTTTAPTTTTTAPTTTTTAPTGTTTTTAPTGTTTTTAPTGTTTTRPPTTTTTAPTGTTTTTAPTGTTTTTAPGPAPGTCDNLTPTIVGTAGPDNIIGTPGNDVILAGGGNDSVYGGGGDDVICGGAGNDRLIGADGNDRLFGDAGSDQLFGGPGNDALNGGLNGDACYGEAGTDTAAACETITGLP